MKRLLILIIMMCFIISACGGAKKATSDTVRESIESGGVIVATGGLSYPATGSTGDGFRFAEESGHSIEPLRPALVPMLTQDADLKTLKGLSLKNVRASLAVE